MKEFQHGQVVIMECARDYGFGVSRPKGVKENDHDTEVRGEIVQ